MKQIVLIIAIILLVNRGQASESQPATGLTFKERQRIAWAIKVLETYQVFNVSENQCVQFEPTLIEQLQSEGLLNRRGSAYMSICIGSGR